MVFFVGTVVFNSSTTTGDSYYIGQPLTVTCQHSAIQPNGTVSFGVVLKEDGSIYVLCKRLFTNLDHWIVDAATKLLMIGIKFQTDCDVTPLNTTTITFTINEELAPYRLKCVDVFGGFLSNSSLLIGAENVKGALKYYII